MTHIGHILSVKVDNGYGETAYAERRWCWNIFVASRDADGHTHVAFMDIPFVPQFEEAAYEAKSSKVIDRDKSVLEDPSLSLRCGSDNVGDELFASNPNHWAKDI